MMLTYCYCIHWLNFIIPDVCCTLFIRILPCIVVMLTLYDDGRKLVIVVVIAVLSDVILLICCFLFIVSIGIVVFYYYCIIIILYSIVLKSWCYWSIIIDVGNIIDDVILLTVWYDGDYHCYILVMPCCWWYHWLIHLFDCWFPWYGIVLRYGDLIPAVDDVVVHLLIIWLKLFDDHLLLLLLLLLMIHCILMITVFCLHYYCWPSEILLVLMILLFGTIHWCYFVVLVHCCIYRWLLFLIHCDDNDTWLLLKLTDYSVLTIVIHL